MKTRTLGVGLLNGLAIALVCVRLASATEARWDEVTRVDEVASSAPSTVAPRTSDLAPRIIGSEFTGWDGSAEHYLGYSAGPAGTVGEYVQAFNLFGTLTRVIVCGHGTPAHVAGVVYDDDGPGGGPGTQLVVGEATLLPFPATGFTCGDVSIPALVVSGRVFVGVRNFLDQDPGFSISIDKSAASSQQDAYFRGGNPATAGFFLLRNNIAGAKAFGVGGRLVTSGQAMAPCFDGSTVVCLNGGRFRIEIDWRKPNQNEGLGIDSGLRTVDSDVLWFFVATNLEMLIKVLDACASSNRYWVFFAATTNVEFTVTVTDTHTGKVRTYFNPLGRPAPPVQDTDAFATCP